MFRGLSLRRTSAPSGVGDPERLARWRPPRPEPEELQWAREAMDDRRLGEAERHLQRALTSDPECAAVRSLMGLLHEQVGEHHAAYRCYRLSLMLDPDDPVAADGLTRYCRRFGYDASSRAINPAAAHPEERRGAAP